MPLYGRTKRGKPHPLALQGRFPLAAWPVSGGYRPLRRSYFSPQEIWRGSTEAEYSSAWRKWDGWCLERATDPLSAHLSSILEFLYEEFQAGKQYWTVNTFRSAISMTHTELDGRRVSQHPLVCRFLRGVFNARPPMPKILPRMGCGRGTVLPWKLTRQ